jgi:hypothetical protein
MLKKTKTRRVSPDSLLKTSKEGEIELPEQELSKVSGGLTKGTTKDKLNPETISVES